MKKPLIALLSLVIVTAASGVARAQTTPPEHGNDRGAFVIGVGAGGLFPQPLSRLETSFLVDAEVGYVLPFLHRAIGLTFDAGYTQPTASGSQTDPRVTSNGGMYMWNLTQQELLVGFTVTFRLTMIMNGRLAPYIGIGPRLWFTRSQVMGSAGSNMIEQSTEQSTQVGLSAPLGVDFGLGPGRVFLQGLFLWAPISNQVTGQSNLGSIDVLAGYRLWL
jgi:opacity protein-like surface antigen